MRVRKLMSLALASSVLFVAGACLLALPGCGEDANAPINDQADIKDQMKDSMDFMQKKYAKKK